MQGYFMLLKLLFLPKASKGPKIIPPDIPIAASIMFKNTPPHLSVPIPPFIFRRISVSGKSNIHPYIVIFFNKFNLILNNTYEFDNTYAKQPDMIAIPIIKEANPDKNTAKIIYSIKIKRIKLIKFNLDHIEIDIPMSMQLKIKDGINLHS